MTSCATREYPPHPCVQHPSIGTYLGSYFSKQRDSTGGTPLQVIFSSCVRICSWIRILCFRVQSKSRTVTRAAELFQFETSPVCRSQNAVINNILIFILGFSTSRFGVSGGASSTARQPVINLCNAIEQALQDATRGNGNAGSIHNHMCHCCRIRCDGGESGEFPACIRVGPCPADWLTRAETDQQLYGVERLHTDDPCIIPFIS